MSDFKHRKIGVRCYCLPLCGAAADPYTVIYTGRYRHLTSGEYWYRGMSAHPTHPQGVGMLGTSASPIDNRGWGQRGGYSHLGKAIKFDQLPVDCQKVVMADCFELGTFGYASA